MNSIWRGPPEPETLSAMRDNSSDSVTNKKHVTIKPVAENVHFLSPTAATVFGSYAKAPSPTRIRLRSLVSVKNLAKMFSGSSTPKHAASLMTDSKGLGGTADSKKRRCEICNFCLELTDNGEIISSCTHKSTNISQLVLQNTDKSKGTALSNPKKTDKQRSDERKRRVRVQSPPPMKDQPSKPTTTNRNPTPFQKRIPSQPEDDDYKPTPHTASPNTTSNRHPTPYRARSRAAATGASENTSHTSKRPATPKVKQSEKSPEKTPLVIKGRHRVSLTIDTSLDNQASDHDISREEDHLQDISDAIQAVSIEEKVDDVIEEAMNQSQDDPVEGALADDIEAASAEEKIDETEILAAGTTVDASAVSAQVEDEVVAEEAVLTDSPVEESSEQVDDLLVDEAVANQEPVAEAVVEAEVDAAMVEDHAAMVGDVTDNLLDEAASPEPPSDAAEVKQAVESINDLMVEDEEPEVAVESDVIETSQTEATEAAAEVDEAEQMIEVVDEQLAEQEAITVEESRVDVYVTDSEVIDAAVAMDSQAMVSSAEQMSYEEQAIAVEEQSVDDLIVSEEVQEEKANVVTVEESIDEVADSAITIQEDVYNESSAIATEDQVMEKVVQEEETVIAEVTAIDSDSCELASSSEEIQEVLELPPVSAEEAAAMHASSLSLSAHESYHTALSAEYANATESVVTDEEIVIHERQMMMHEMPTISSAGAHMSEETHHDAHHLSKVIVEESYSMDESTAIILDGATIDSSAMTHEHAQRTTNSESAIVYHGSAFSHDESVEVSETQTETFDSSELPYRTVRPSFDFHAESSEGQFVTETSLLISDPAVIGATLASDTMIHSEVESIAEVESSAPRSHTRSSDGDFGMMTLEELPEETSPPPAAAAPVVVDSPRMSRASMMNRRESFMSFGVSQVISLGDDSDDEDRRSVTGAGDTKEFVSVQAVLEMENEDEYDDDMDRKEGD
jgi:hypothetical protein